MIGLLPSLNRARRRAPSGYRPGAALDRLARNTEPYACERTAPSLLRLTLPQGPQIEIGEQVGGCLWRISSATAFGCRARARCSFR